MVLFLSEGHVSEYADGVQEVPDTNLSQIPSIYRFLSLTHARLLLYGLCDSSSSILIVLRCRCDYVSEDKVSFVLFTLSELDVQALRTN